jgi:hypothetical protein
MQKKVLLGGGAQLGGSGGEGGEGGRGGGWLGDGGEKQGKFATGTAQMPWYLPVQMAAAQLHKQAGGKVRAHLAATSRNLTRRADTAGGQAAIVEL